MQETILIPGVGKNTLVTVTTLIDTEEIPTVDPNEPPTVNAGASQTIQLPINEVVLNGSANDTDGEIVSYLWEEVLNDGSIIKIATTPLTKASGLSAGEYLFKFTATDNEGASTFSTTKVTVKEAVIIPPPSEEYKLTFSRGYDQPSDVNENQLGRGKQTTFGDRGVFMSEVRNGDSQISSGYRSEQQYNQREANPIEGVWEWECYYENWDQIRGKNGHSFQFHPNSSSGSAVLSLQNYNGKFNIVRSLNGRNTHQSGTLKNTEQNRWYKMKVEARWSAGADGYINWYIDGELYYSYKGATSSQSGVYVKIGQNCWPPIPTRSVVYYDNFLIYTKQ